MGDCYPLHILCLSPALFRLTEVVLILLMLIRNRVRRLAQFYEMLPVAVDAWPFLFLFFIAQIRAAILLLHGLTWPVLQLFKTDSFKFSSWKFDLSVELCPIEFLLLMWLFFSGKYF